MLPVERGVGQPVLRLMLSAVGLSLRPYPCGAELSVLGVVECVGAAQRELQVAGQFDLEVEVGVEVHVLRVVLLGEQGARRIDFRGCAVFRALVAADGRVLRRGGVEQGLLVEDTLGLLRRAEHAEVDVEMAVEGLLRDVELGHEVVHALHVDDRAVVHEGQGSAVAGGLSAAAEGDVVVLHESRARDGVGEVGV